jgi:hypothetical protein
MTNVPVLLWLSVNVMPIVAVGLSESTVVLVIVRAAVGAASTLTGHVSYVPSGSLLSIAVLGKVGGLGVW